MEPKVLVAAPTWEGHKYILPKYLDRVKNLSYSNYSILLVNNGKTKAFTRYLIKQGIKAIRVPYSEDVFERITVSRNAIINYILQHPDIEYVLCLDTDVIPPKDIIQSLLKHDKDIVGGLIHAGFENKFPCVLKNGYLIKNGVRGLQFYSWKEIKEMKTKSLLQEVYATSVACLLIRRKIFESGVRFRYAKSIRVGEDIWFFAECNEKGFKFFVDLSRKIPHFNKSRRNIMKRWSKLMKTKSQRKSKSKG